VRPAIGTLLVPVALAFTSVGCHLGSLGARVTPDRASGAGWLLVPQVPMVAQRARTDCGAAALAMVLRYWQPTTSNDTVRASIGTVDEKTGVTAGRLREIARDHGLDAFLVQASFEDLTHEIDRQRPVIVGIVQVAGGRAYPHYEVVVGINARTRELLVADPAEGWRDESFDRFQARWRPARQLALVVFPRNATAVDDRPPLHRTAGLGQRGLDLRAAGHPPAQPGRGDPAAAAAGGPTAAAVRPGRSPAAAGR
jgi:predicted double-glycine peptidase